MTDLEIRTLVAKALCPTAWRLDDGHEYTTGAVAVMQLHAFKAADNAIAVFASRTEVRCAGCGSAWTDADLARAKAATPGLVACCPERKPMTIDAFYVYACNLEAELARERRIASQVPGWGGAPF